MSIPKPLRLTSLGSKPPQPIRLYADDIGAIKPHDLGTGSLILLTHTDVILNVAEASNEIVVNGLVDLPSFRFNDPPLRVRPAFVRAIEPHRYSGGTQILTTSGSKVFTSADPKTVDELLWPVLGWKTI